MVGFPTRKIIFTFLYNIHQNIIQIIPDERGFKKSYRNNKKYLSRAFTSDIL